MTKQRVCLDYCDFWFNFPKTDNYYHNLLQERFDVRICDHADFLFYGPYLHEHRLQSGVRIFASQESGAPDYRECDYSVSCLKIDDARHLQLPTYVFYGDPGLIVKKDEDAARVLAAKTKFCSIVVSGQHPRKNRNRAEFFEKLSRYQTVDSGGRYKNNVGGPITGGSKGKINFLKSYKFNIAFENGLHPGYTTEKIFEAMVARTLPIYWGNPLIAEEFNPKSFLNRADFPSDEALIEKIIELDRDDNKYLAYTREPFFHSNQPNRFYNHGRFLDFFERVFSREIVPVAQRRQRWFKPGRWVAAKRHHWHPAPRWLTHSQTAA
jgi:hypothetical protein